MKANKQEGRILTKALLLSLNGNLVLNKREKMYFPKVILHDRPSRVEENNKEWVSLWTAVDTKNDRPTWTPLVYLRSSKLCSLMTQPERTVGSAWGWDAYSLYTISDRKETVLYIFQKKMVSFFHTLEWTRGPGRSWGHVLCFKRNKQTNKNGKNDFFSRWRPRNFWTQQVL